MKFRVRPAQTEESPSADEAPSGFAIRAAREKALEVHEIEPTFPVLGADTVVEINGRILGKPSSRKDAEEMLKALVGRRHLVHTAVALAVGGQCQNLLDTAEVRMAEASTEVIRWYVDTGEPMDKAGAYAIQGLGGLLVEEVIGSPHTVVGLPIHRLPTLFDDCGLDFWSMLSR
jgi:septum formation protein